MKIWKLCAKQMLLLMSVLLSLPAQLAFSANITPMTPELAAKKEMIRKQEEQRITPEKRTFAVEALKAERMKVYQAKKTVQQSTLITTDNK